MAWTLNQSSTAGFTGPGTSVNTSFGVAPSAGDRIFVVIGAFNDSGGAVTPVFTDNQGNTYTTASFTYEGSLTGHGVWIAASTSLIGTPSGTFTCTVSGFNANSSMTAQAYAFSGGAIGGPDATAAANSNAVAQATSDTGAAGNVTTHANDLIIHGTNLNGSITSFTEAISGTVPASGWANLLSFTSTSGGGLSINYVVCTSENTPRYLQTLDPAIAWFSALAAFRPRGFSPMFRGS